MRLYYDAMLPTPLRDSRARIRYVDLDLVDGGEILGPCSQQLPEVADAEIADAAYFHLASVDGIAHGAPRWRRGLGWMSGQGGGARGAMTGVALWIGDRWATSAGRVQAVLSEWRGEMEQ